MSTRRAGAGAGAGAERRQLTVLDGKGHRELARRVVNVVLQRTLARLELGLDLLALRLVGGGGELARKLRLERPVGEVSA